MSMHSLDWFMHLVLLMLLGSTAVSELEQSRVCDVQIFKAMRNEDSAAATMARRWAPPLMAVQKARQLLLIPFTVATGPILAVEEGLDALSVALNVMAILFIFDVDDSAFSLLLSRPQRAYLESVSIEIDRSEHRHLAWFSIGIVVAMFFASLFPLILFDPDAIFSANAPSDKFAGFFHSGEPVNTLTLFSVTSFSILMIVELLHAAMSCRKGTTSAGKSIILWQAFFTAIMTYAGIHSGQAMGALSQDALNAANLELAGGNSSAS
jgi:hypothetical protein